MASAPSESKPSSLRLLILAPTTNPQSKPPFPPLLEALTGSSPSSDVTSFAGYTSHPPLQLRTRYYQSDVSIWCDELPLPGPISGDDVLLESHPSEDLKSAGSDNRDTGAAQEAATSTLADWKEQMLSSAAGEVRRVIGGLVLILPVSAISNSEVPEDFTALVETVHALREAIEDDSYGRDIASILVLQGSSPSVKTEKLDALMEKLEDVCLSDKGILGWDFVAWDGQLITGEDEVTPPARNEYGEQTGIKRVLEVVQGIDWTVSLDADDDEDIGLGLGDDEDNEITDFRPTNILGSGGFSGLDHELQREMMELKFSMLSHEDEDDATDGTRPRRSKEDTDDEDFQVDQLPALMEQVVAIREAGLEMGPAKRERFAKREIERIMREMG